jgi:hypothetical protein
VPWLPATPRRTDAAALALLADAARSDALIAALTNVSYQSVANVRARLEATGRIEAIPVTQRQQRPRPIDPQTPTRLAIASLGPCATPREVADAAHVSIQAAWRAIQRTKPALPDAAASTDSIRVQIIYPSPGAGATAELLRDPARSNYLTAQAAGCDEATVRRARARLEAAGTLLHVVTEQRTPIGHRHHRGPMRHPPPIIDLPKPPDWSAATCQRVPFPVRAYWTSDARDERAYAATLCGRCPVLEACRTWSLALPVVDMAIYAGMSQAERLRRKRAAMRELAKQAMAGIRR